MLQDDMVDTSSGDRTRRSVRLDPAGWTMLVRIADAYWEGKRHSATDAAVLDALSPLTLYPSKPEQAFNDALTALCETVARRLSQPTKTFHFGDDAAKALIKASDVYPALLDKPLPGFIRKLPTAIPALPSGPWVVNIPEQFAHLLPDSDWRSFVDKALVNKGTRLGFSGLPEKTLPVPTALPSLQAVMTSRHLDEALVAILCALPQTAPLKDDRLQTTLRWLASAVQSRLA
jgi:hypothetical protein